MSATATKAKAKPDAIAKKSREPMRFAERPKSANLKAVAREKGRAPFLCRSY